MIRFTALVALALVLSSCSWFRKDDPRGCPRLGIIADAADLTRYRDGPGRDITDQVFTARVTDVSGSCRLDSASANVDMRVALVAERGAAAVGNSAADIEYFVAVTGPQDQILAKQNFSTRIDFSGRNRAGVAEELAQRIPLRGDSNPADYAVLVGFQLSPDELADNRRRRGAR